VDAGSGEVRLWVNGGAVDTRPFSAVALNDVDGERLVIGATSDVTQAGEPFQGALDDVRLYGRQLTVAAWMQTTSTARMRVFSKDRVGTPGNFILRHHDTWNAWVFSVFDADYGHWRHAIWPGDAINDGAWHHVAGVVDTRAGSIRLVVNGATVAEAPFASATLDDSDGERLVLGADSHPTAPGDWFDGALDEVRVYHRALAPIELRQLAGQPAAGYRDRMIAHLTLDETTGTTATDGGLFGHHGTLLGGFDFATHGLPGPYGGALDFDGQSSRIDLGALDFTGLGALTVSAWIRPTDPTRNQRVIAKDRVGTPGAFILRYVAATGAWHWQVFDADHGSNGGWRVVTSTANLFDGGWHQLAGVLDAAAGEIRLYVEGTLAGTAPFSAAALDDSDRERLVIGADAHPDAPDRFFAGAIDDVRLYGFAFADADVAALQASATADFDLDGDGVPDAQDAFPADPTEWQDSDFDGVGDNADAYPNDPTATSAVTWPFSVLQTGAYELWVTVPGGHNRTALARYTVSHADGVAEVSVDRSGAAGCACDSSIAAPARACWWRRDG